MSTNFYLIRRAPRSKKQELIDLIENDHLTEAREVLSEICTETNIHLGKRSGGWQFCWYLNDEKYYGASEKDIRAFINNEVRTHNAQIVDEYGAVFTEDQFWNEEIGPCLREGISIVDNGYYCNNYSWRDDAPDLFKKYSANIYGDFISEDGLKFSINEFC